MGWMRAGDNYLNLFIGTSRPAAVADYGGRETGARAVNQSDVHGFTKRHSEV